MTDKLIRTENDLEAQKILAARDEFDDQMHSFVTKSLSAETRRAYKRVVKEFVEFFPGRDPLQITSKDIITWRDSLITRKKSAATIVFKLAVIRSGFNYLKLIDVIRRNPALPELVPIPALSEDLRGRALTNKEVRYLLAGPDRSTAGGARDYALLLTLLRTGLRVSEACSLSSTSIKWSHGRLTLTFTNKGGRERRIPFPLEVKKAIDDYIALDRDRRRNQHTDENTKRGEYWIFQPLLNYRTLEFDKPISTTKAWQIVRRWSDFGGIGKVSPHDLRRTAITRALEQGLTYRQVQMMTGHKDPKTIIRYDHARENMEQNAINFINYDD